MTDPDENGARLVAHLCMLEAREDRAALAALRHSLGEGLTLAAAPLVFPVLDFSSMPPSARTRAEDDALLLAGLFALHRETGSVSLATAMKRLALESGSESVEGRFRALLAASRSELPLHLRHAVSLVAGAHVGIDWHDLLLAIRRWDTGDERSRRAWARDYWAAPEPKSSKSDDTASE